MLYIFDTENADISFVYESVKYLSKQRKERLDVIRAENDKINCCAAYLLLRYGLFREYGERTAPIFEYEKREKPYITNISGAHFNISHCKNAVACILSDENTAVDIMDIRSVRPAVIKRSCSEEEQKKLSESSDISRDFIRLWTRKECFVKYTGMGLLTDFRTITEDIPEMGDIHTFESGGSIISYYSHRKNIEVVRVTQDELFSCLQKEIGL